MRLEPERHRGDVPELLLNNWKKKKNNIFFSTPCSNRCIYVAVTETAMYSNRHPTRTLNKLACHTWEIRLNNLTASEVVSFACITPGTFSSFHRSLEQRKSAHMEWCFNPMSPRSNWVNAVTSRLNEGKQGKTKPCQLSKIACLWTPASSHSSVLVWYRQSALTIS